MIAHVILYEPKQEVSIERRQAILDALIATAREIPSVRGLRLGRRIRHGRPGYEQMMREDFEYAVILEFDDVAGLTVYLSHPRHAALGDHFTQSSAAALAYDYEMTDLAPR